MRYAIFTDIHANLEALEAVLAKIDELSQEEPIDQIWFLGDLVGYGPNPNECIAKLRERTDVIIAGNHDWAAVGKIDLEDFSEAARISAQWTAEQLTEEHRHFLANLPERLDMGDCVIVHGSPYGPLWEYLTSEVLAERSFQCFTQRYCFVGHTHVPVIFQQPDTIANTPTVPLEGSDSLPDLEEALQDKNTATSLSDSIPQEPAQPTEIAERLENTDPAGEAATSKIIAARSTLQNTLVASQIEADSIEPSEALQDAVANAVEVVAEVQQQIADDVPNTPPLTEVNKNKEEIEAELEANASELQETDEESQQVQEDSDDKEDEEPLVESDDVDTELLEKQEVEEEEIQRSTEETMTEAEERLNEEIAELLNLLGLSQSMISVTNELIIPPIGHWQAPEGYRAIINPGGVGQPRDGDSRAAFMIYDTQHGFTFYRVSYDIEKTQEKILQAKLPPYLATRLAYGR